MKQTKNKALPKIFIRRLEVKEKVRLMLCGANYSLKSKCYVFNGNKQINDLCLGYLKCKLQQVKYGRCIFKLKWKKTVERSYL